MNYELRKTALGNYPDDMFNGLYLDLSNRKGSRKNKRFSEREEDDTFMVHYIDPKYFG